MTVNRPLKLTLSWLVMLALMVFIYHLSAEPASLSDANSKGIVTHVVDTAVEITKAPISGPEKEKLIDRINSAAREYMHGVVFLALGLAAQNAVMQSGARGRKATALALAICVLYAISDEAHQLFVPGRSFQLSDLAMDTAGSVIGNAVAWRLFHKL